MIRIEAVCERVPGLRPAELADWVARGWICPAGEPPAWMFAETDVARVTLVRDLRSDAGIEPDTLGLVLSLLDQLYATRAALHAALSALDRTVLDRAAARGAAPGQGPRGQGPE